MPNNNEILLSSLANRFLSSMDYIQVTGYKLKQNGIINNEATITKIKRGVQQPSRKMLDKYLECYREINQVWLLTGKGEMLNEENTTEQESASEQREASESTKEETEEQPKVNFTTGVPYYNVDFIGGFDLVLNDQTINPEYLIDFKKYNDATCWCNVTGHSMEPEIHHGDMIALKKIEDRSFLPLGEIYAIVTTNDMRTIKRLGAGKTDDTYTLVPSNKSPEYSPQPLPARMIRTIFQVLGAVKRF